jgi:hypothetical protein
MAGARWARKCSVFDGDEECDTVRSAGLTCHAGRRVTHGSIKARCRHRQLRVPASSLHEPGPFLGRTVTTVDDRLRTFASARGISDYREVKLLLLAVARLP